MCCKIQADETESIKGRSDSNGDTDYYLSVSDHTSWRDSPSTPASATGNPTSFSTGIKSLPTPFCGFCSYGAQRISATSRVPVSVAAPTTLPWRGTSSSVSTSRTDLSMATEFRSRTVRTPKGSIGFVSLFKWSGKLFVQRGLTQKY